jgi:hypothetical protein
MNKDNIIKELDKIKQQCENEKIYDIILEAINKINNLEDFNYLIKKFLIKY